MTIKRKVGYEIDPEIESARAKMVNLKMNNKDKDNSIMNDEDIEIENTEQ
jgi:hypothetical protein